MTEKLSTIPVSVRPPGMTLQSGFRRQTQGRLHNPGIRLHVRFGANSISPDKPAGKYESLMNFPNSCACKAIREPCKDAGSFAGAARAGLQNSNKNQHLRFPTVSIKRECVSDQAGRVSNGLAASTNHRFESFRNEMLAKLARRSAILIPRSV